MKVQETAARPGPGAGAFDRFKKGLGSMAIGQAIAAANAILLVPFFIAAWGSETYGRWLSLTALVSYLSLADFGGQSYFGNLLAEAYAVGDERDFRLRLAAGVSLYLLVALAGLVGLGGLLLWAGFGLPGSGAPFTVRERWIILCLAANILIGVPGGILVTVYRATGRFAWGTMLGNLIRFALMLGMILVLVQGGSPLAYALATLAGGIATTLVVVVDLRFRIPAIRALRLGWGAARQGFAHLGGALHFWVLSLASLINLQGVILVLGATGSPEAVALFSTHRTAAGLIGYLGALIQAPLWPELTFLHARGQTQDLARILLVTIKVVVLLSGWAALLLWSLLPAVYPAWTGRQLDFDLKLYAILLVQAVLYAGWNTAGWTMLASSRHKALAGWALANALLTVGLAVIFSAQGVYGIALASLTGDLLCGFLAFPRLPAKALNIPVRQVYAAILKPAALLVVPVLFYSWLQRQGPAPWLAAAGAGVSLISLAPMLALALTAQERAWLWARLGFPNPVKA